jgi:hypothetical protein
MDMSSTLRVDIGGPANPGASLTRAPDQAMTEAKGYSRGTCRGVRTHARFRTKRQSFLRFHRCHILETGNDSFRFKNSSAKAAKPAKEKPRNLTNV